MSAVKKARITAKEGYRCAPQGHTVETFPFGAEVTGKVAEWALAAHKANALFDPVEETKVVAPTETKKRRGRPKRKAG